MFISADDHAFLALVPAVFKAGSGNPILVGFAGVVIIVGVAYEVAARRGVAADEACVIIGDHGGGMAVNGEVAVTNRFPPECLVGNDEISG